MKHPDNLQPEGQFSSRQQEEWVPGERADVVKRLDNLKPEGKFQDRPQEQWAPGKKFYRNYMVFAQLLNYCSQNSIF